MMKTNFKISSKMHLFIIISVLIIALGVAVGLVCNFTAGGYFNYNGEWSSYKCVTVSYKYVDFSGDGDSRESVEKICEEAFEANGLSGYIATYGTTTTGGEIVYRFSDSVDDATLEIAQTAIQTAMKAKIGSDSDVVLSSVTVNDDNSLLGGKYTLIMAAIALASVIGVQFVYYLIRYKFTMALAVLLADVHNLAIYVSLLSLCRVPISASAIAFAVLCVVLTMVACAVYFDNMRKIIKDENLSKELSSFEQVDLGAAKSVKSILSMTVSLAALAVVIAVVFIIAAVISSVSFSKILAPVLCAIVCMVATAYGTILFTPSVYSRFKLKADKYKATHVKASKSKDEQKTPAVRRGRRAAQSATAASPNEDTTSD